MKKQLNRRMFLKSGVAAAAAMSLPAFWLPNAAHATSGGPKKLVLLTLAGGNDGLNTVVPTETYHVDGSIKPDGENSQYDHYRALRPTLHLKKMGDGDGPHLIPLGEIPGNSMAHQLRVSSASDAVVSSPINGTDPIGAVDFSLHPAFASLKPIWDAGHMAIFPATHCGPDASRSHFYQSEYIGHGLHTTHSEQRGDGKGWVGRYFEQKYGVASLNGIEGFDFESGYYPLMDGNVPVIGLSDPENINLGRDGATIKANTLRINNNRSNTTNALYAAYAQVQQELFARIDKLEAVDYSDPGSKANPSYPTHDLGKRFRRAAALIKDPVIGAEIEVINIDAGGYDSHDKQVSNGNSAAGKHADNLKDCADTIKAFYDDMHQSGCGDEVMVLVKTEFGRTMGENDNFGTDHGRASCWIAIGGQNNGGSRKNINGGMYGRWPGIATDAAGNTDLDGLHQRKYLHQTTDYRDILSEIIANHLDNNVNPSAAFNPGDSSDYARIPQGFIGGPVLAA